MLESCSFWVFSKSDDIVQGFLVLLVYISICYIFLQNLMFACATFKYFKGHTTSSDAILQRMNRLRLEVSTKQNLTGSFNLNQTLDHSTFSNKHVNATDGRDHFVSKLFMRNELIKSTWQEPHLFSSCQQFISFIFSIGSRIHTFQLHECSSQFLQYLQCIIQILPVQIRKRHSFLVHSRILHSFQVSIHITYLPKYFYSFYRQILRIRLRCRFKGEGVEVVLLVDGHVVGAHQLELLPVLLEFVTKAPFVARFLLKHFFELCDAFFMRVVRCFLECSFFTYSTPSSEQYSQVSGFIQYQLHFIEQIVTTRLELANLHSSEIHIIVLLQMLIKHNHTVIMELPWWVTRHKFVRVDLHLYFLEVFLSILFKVNVVVCSRLLKIFRSVLMLK